MPLGLAHANVDERFIAESVRFDVGRVPNRHLAFGHGRHFCAGAPLARLELQHSSCVPVTWQLRVAGC
ncbi:cytochrome P450 [Micromonospora sp. NBC_00421]|uniref:cytochrome P450 n=1 Tax=Micromonospora sp. NBC_00421 TaxID=2975976 RepID=UPI002E1DD252